VTAVQEAPTVRIPRLPATALCSSWASVGTDARVYVRPLPGWLRANPASLTRPITDDDVLAVLDANSFGGELHRDPNGGVGLGVHLVRYHAPLQPLNLVASRILGYPVRGPLAVVGGWDEVSQTYAPLTPCQLDSLHTLVDAVRTEVHADRVLGPPTRRLMAYR